VTPSRPVVPVLVAPTASGKTAAVLRLAERPEGRGLEVVNADALQVYRGFDIGTAKPTAVERARVPHHLIDLVAPETTMDVATWTAAAEDAIAAALERGARPLVVGGTGFYVDALELGVPTTPAADPALRAALEAERAERGDAALLADLRSAAPTDADRSQGNPRRVVRALEVLRATGRPPSSFPRRPPRFAIRAFARLPSATALDARVPLGWLPWSGPAGWTRSRAWSRGCRRRRRHGRRSATRAWPRWCGVRPRWRRRCPPSPWPRGATRSANGPGSRVGRPVRSGGRDALDDADEELARWLAAGAP
jgi:tRNA dimethylallyltransferase